MNGAAPATIDVLIVDDDQPCRLYLQQIVTSIPGANVVAMAASGPEALQLARQHQPQVVFLDVDMPQMSGLETAQALARLHPDIFFIFATAYPKYALQAFEVHPFDYILKPLDEERIRKTLRQLIARLKTRPGGGTSQQPSFAVQTHGETHLLRPDQILYIESSRADVRIKTADREFRFKGNLGDWQRRLAPFGFVPCHRSFLVNLAQILRISRCGYTFDLWLTSGDRIPLSRGCIKELKKRLGELGAVSR